MQSFLKQKPLEDKLLTVTWSLSQKKKTNTRYVKWLARMKQPPTCKEPYWTPLEGQLEGIRRLTAATYLISLLPRMCRKPHIRCKYNNHRFYTAINYVCKKILFCITFKQPADTARNDALRFTKRKNKLQLLGAPKVSSKANNSTISFLLQLPPITTSPCYTNLCCLHLTLSLPKTVQTTPFHSQLLFLVC